MSIKTSLETSLHDAMRQKDVMTRDTIRVLLSAIKMQEVEAGKAPDDNAILSIIQKEVKIRKETIDELENTSRVDLIDKAQKELVILEKFLPAQLTDDEIALITTEVVTNTGAKSFADMGRVMGILVPRLVGKASPDRISRVVRKILSQ